MDNNNALLATLVGMVRLTPNDAELGAKIRNIITPIVQSQGIQEGKTLLKG